MLKRTFLVTVAVNDFDHGLLETSSFHASMMSRFNNSVIIVKNVKAHYPPNEERTHKVGAIKKVRDLLSLTLRDAKFLVDHAESNGSVRFMHISVITHKDDPTCTYQVIDHDKE